MHKIEVDDDVFEFLKGKAQPFVDSPNSVLRRELLAGNVSRPGRAASSEAPSLLATAPLEFGVPIGLPEALRQTLEVVSCMRHNGLERTTATRLVAKRHGVERETVADKYCRQLGLTTAQLDRMLAEPSLDQLSARLRSKFPSYSAQIRSVVAAAPRRATG